MRGMVLSLAVTLLAAGFIYLFIPHDDDADPVKPVGYRVELQSARRAAPYPVAAPQGLPESWRATSVTYERDGRRGAAWHLGFVTPDTEYAAIEQSDTARVGKYIDDVTQGSSKTDETSRIDGEEWTHYEGGKYDALVRRSDGDDGKYTTVVTGTASVEQLTRLAGSLSEKGGVPDKGGAADGGPQGG